MVEVLLDGPGTSIAAKSQAQKSSKYSFEMLAEATIAQAPQAKPARYPHQPRPSSVSLRECVSNRLSRGTMAIT